MLAEDNIVNHRLTSTILESCGCEVDVVENGRDAVEKVKNGDYRIVFMDFHMPQMNGIEATKAIRKFNEKLPVIALTIIDSEEMREKCKKAGMNDFLGKPVTLQQMQETIRRWGGQ